MSPFFDGAMRNLIFAILGVVSFADKLQYFGTPPAFPCSRPAHPPRDAPPRYFRLADAHTADVCPYAQPG